MAILIVYIIKLKHTGSRPTQQHVKETTEYDDAFTPQAVEPPIPMAEPLYEEVSNYEEVLPPTEEIEFEADTIRQASKEIVTAKNQAYGQATEVDVVTNQAYGQLRETGELEAETWNMWTSY